jgi:hypothetical protein
MRIRSWLVGIALATLLSSGCGLCETVRCWRMNHPILGRLPPRPAAPVIVEPTVPAPPPGQSLYPAIPNGRCCSPTVVSPNGIPPNGTYYAPPANGSYLAPASPNPGMQPTVPRPDSSRRPVPPWHRYRVRAGDRPVRRLLTCSHRNRCNRRIIASRPPASRTLPEAQIPRSRLPTCLRTLPAGRLHTKAWPAACYRSGKVGTGFSRRVTHGVASETSR